MEKSKFKIIVLCVIGICMFTLIPAVQAAKNGIGNVNIRSIDDWVVNNRWGVGVPWETGYVGGDGKGNHYWMWFDSLDGVFTGNQYEYGGHVKEKLLKDGSIEVTVYLFVKEIFVEMYYALYDENDDPIWSMEYFGDTGDLLLFAYVNYIFQLKFILDAEYDGYDGDEFPWWLYEGSPAGTCRSGGTRELGGELPYFEDICYIPEQMGIHLKSLMFIGVGDGLFYEPGWRWPAPDEPWPVPEWGILTEEQAKVFFFYHAEFQEDYSLIGGYGDPFAPYAANWGDFWPLGSTGFISSRIYVK